MFNVPLLVLHANNNILNFSSYDNLDVRSFVVGWNKGITVFGLED